VRTHLCIALSIIVPGTAAAQSPASLSYRGWALGISRDSAINLAKSQNGQVLDCVGGSDRMMFCRTLGGAQPDISAYFSAEPRRLEMVTIIEPLGAAASADSVAHWFRDQWGDPKPLPKRDSTSGPTIIAASQWLGMWFGAGGAIGSATIMSIGDKRMLGVAIDNPLRYLRGRPPQPKARTLIDEDTLPP
jgi:hypothetical protein